MTDEKLYKLYKEMDQEDLIRIAINDKKRAENSRRELEKTITRNKSKDKEIEELQQRIDKAINYIIKYNVEYLHLDQEELLKILKGEIEKIEDEKI